MWHVVSYFPVYFILAQFIHFVYWPSLFICLLFHCLFIWPSLFIVCLFIGPVYSFVYYFILAQPCGMWHLSSLIRDGTCALSSGSIES